MVVVNIIPRILMNCICIWNSGENCQDLSTSFNLQIMFAGQLFHNTCLNSQTNVQTNIRGDHSLVWGPDFFRPHDPTPETTLLWVGGGYKRGGGGIKFLLRRGGGSKYTPTPLPLQLPYGQNKEGGSLASQKIAIAEKSLRFQIAKY